MRDVERAPANVTDVVVGAELLSAQHDLVVVGDKGSISAPLVAALHYDCNVTLLTMPRSNQQDQPTDAWRHLFNPLRQIVETVNSQLVQQLQVAVNHAHTCGGVVARLCTKPTAHTLCVALNRLMGTPAWLQTKQLAFPI
ncbi:MAG TPA: transposase [Ktedonobacterales bacterium]|nr:transposase [Ktedonobacterales bacterium]